MWVRCQRGLAMPRLCHARGVMEDFIEDLDDDIDAGGPAEDVVAGETPVGDLDALDAEDEPPQIEGIDDEDGAEDGAMLLAAGILYGAAPLLPLDGVGVIGPYPGKMASPLSCCRRCSRKVAEELASGAGRSDVEEEGTSLL